MKHFLIFIILMCLVMTAGIVAKAGDESSTSKSNNLASMTTQNIYPIAPGIWYPGNGPLPEKPIRYYRVRCWPGCHHGSAYGKYPKKPLNMKPIFSTSTVQSDKNKE